MILINKKYFGEWHISETEITLNGFLEINNDSKEYVLNLYSDKVLEMPYCPKLIYGSTFEGKEFSLYQCSVSAKTSYSLANEYEARYIFKVQCSYIFEGIAFKNIQEVQLTDVSFSLSNLDIWAFQPSIESHFKEDDTHVIQSKKLEAIVADLDDYKISLRYFTGPSYSSKLTNEKKLKTNCFFEVQFKHPTPIECIIKTLKIIKEFYVLCTNKPSYIGDLITYSRDKDSLKSLYGVKIFGNAIETLDTSSLEQIESYISLQDLINDFETCMKNWFLKNEKLKPVIELYLASIYQKTSFERHFLNLVQALEAYHRLTGINEIMPKKEHKEKVESIIDSSPAEHRQWLKGKLNFSNEPSLHERLEILLNPKTNNPLFEADYHFLFLLNYKDKESLIRIIKRTRNYNTHFDESLKSKAAKGAELRDLTVLLKIVVEFYLLQELGIREEIILEKTQKKISDLLYTVHFRNESIIALQ